MFKSVETGDTEALRKALAQGVSPNLYNPEFGPLIFSAVAYHNHGAVKLLIDAGADVNKPNPEGDTALILPMLGGDCDVARLLLSAGADSSRKWMHAKEAALDPKLQGKTARELYYIYKQDFPAQWEKKKACWEEVERVMK